MKRILIIVDMQNGFVNENTLDVKNRIGELLRQHVFDTVIATKYKNKKGSSVEKILDWKKLRTPDTQRLVPEVEKHSDYVIEKETYSSYTEEMEETLKKIENGVLPQEVFIAGVDTDSCVSATAFDIFEAGIRPVILADYCGSTGGQDYHLAALKALERPIGRDNIISKKKITKEEIDSFIKTMENKHKQGEEK